MTDSVFDPWNPAYRPDPDAFWNDALEEVRDESELPRTPDFFLRGLALLPVGLAAP
ncbi:MAG: hypothetical protein ACFCVC_17050 [Acidimicrobiia bacterium]